MISDKKLIFVAVFFSITAIIFLFFLPSEQDFDLINAEILASYPSKEQFLLKMYACQEITGLSQTNISKGNHTLLVRPGGHNFYYVEGVLELNGSNT